MDMREVSAMTEASGLPGDQDTVEHVAMSGASSAGSRDTRTPAVSFPDELRRLVREAPLPSLLMAFVLGVLVARR